MKINGIGVINKKAAIKELGLDRDKEGREALRKGAFTDEEIGSMYKYKLIKKACKIGSCNDTFVANYNRIPDSLKEKLTPEELAELVEALIMLWGRKKRIIKKESHT